jgi:hypothetical protein
VSYRDQSTANKFGGDSSRQASQARDQFRGRADADRSSLQRNGAPGADRPIGNNGAGNRPGGGGAGAQNRPAAGGGAQNRPGGGGAGTQNRPQNSGAFNGMNNRGSDVRAQSQRGQSSRSASPSPSARPSGGSRGGGGGRGGGGRGGRR